MLLMKRSALMMMSEWLQKAYPNEGCGLMIGTGNGLGIRTVERVHGCKNIEKYPGASYVMDPAEMLHVSKQLDGSDRQILGVFHSHPNMSCSPSGIDLSNAFPGYSYVIVSVDRGRIRQMRCWLLDQGRIRDHTTRRWKGYREFDEESLHILP